ncbi:MAG: hypothetical protein NC388_07385 [Clostridium sp.]|nr:hypothetical protein [Clostridium sp.]
MPAHTGNGGNMQDDATVAAWLQPMSITVDGEQWFGLYQVSASTYVHANHDSAIDPNLNYHSAALGETGSSVKFAFYPVTVVSMTDVTFNYKSWGDEDVTVATTTAVFLPGTTLTVNDVPAIDFYSNYNIDADITVSDGMNPVTVTCDPAFPFESGKMYALRVNNNSYFNRQTDAATTTGATLMDVARSGSFYVPEHVTGTNLFTFRHAGTKKYLTLANAVNQTQPTYVDEATEWTSGTGATSYFRITQNGDGFNLQHPGDANANMGNHVSGNLGTWNINTGASAGAPESRIYVDGEVTAALQDYANSIADDGSTTADGWIVAVASDGLRMALASAISNPTIDNISAYVLVEAGFVDYIEEGAMYQIVFERGTGVMGNYAAFADEAGTVSQDASSRQVLTKLNDTEMTNAYFLSALWRFSKEDNHNKVKIQNVNSDFYLGSVDNGDLVTTIQKNWGRAYTIDGGANGQWTMQDESASGDNYLNTYYVNNGASQTNRNVGYWRNGLSDPGNIVKIRKVEEITISLNTAEGASYATMCLPFEVRIKDGDATKAYTVFRPEDANYVKMAEITDGIIPANEGVLLKNGNAAAEAVFVVSSTGKTAIEGNILSGVTVRRNDINQDEMLTFGYTAQYGVGFYRPSTDYLKNNIAFIANPGNEMGTLSLVFEDATGIEEVKTMTGGTEQTLYDLSGRRVTNPAKGIYIRNGKKICIQ